MDKSGFTLTATGPMASGKTVCLNKIEKFLNSSGYQVARLDGHDNEHSLRVRLDPRQP